MDELLFDVAGAVNALSSSVPAAVVGVVVVAVVPDACVEPDDVDPAAFALLVAFFAPTAMQPASANIPTTLDTPVIFRARRAGCGRRLRRGACGIAVCMTTTIAIRANKNLGAK